MLADGEVVVLHRHPHFKRLVGPVLALEVLTVVAAFVAAVIGRTGWEQAAKTVLCLVVLALWVSAVGWLVVVPVLSWRSTHFVVTDRRLMFRQGLLTRSGIDVPLARIDGIEFARGPIERLLGTGTLIVESGAQDPLEFYDVPAVERVHALLYAGVFDDGDGRGSNHG